MKHSTNEDWIEERLPKAGPRNRYFYSHPEAFQVSYHPVQAGEFNIYLFDEIVSAEQFIPAIEALKAAGSNDVVHIHLSTPGGSMDATDTFLDELSKCQAKIITHASGGVHSAGTIILLHSDHFFLSRNFNALVHNASYGAGGKASDVRAQVKYTDRHVQKVLSETYAGFLTETEIAQLIEGKDFWFDAEEFGERFERRNEYFRRLMQADEEEQEQTVAIKPRRTRKKAVAQFDEA